MKKFPLGHVALYAKNWYKRYDPRGRGKNKSIFDDLRICLTHDNYSGEYFSDAQVASIIASKVCENLKSSRLEIIQILSGISPHECWKSGYYTLECSWISKEQKEYLKPYNYNEAIVRYFLSVLSMTELKELGELPKPIYDQSEKYGIITPVLPRSRRVTDKKIAQWWPSECLI